MTTRQGDGTPGGYRKPTRPAAVSAPQSGARTDGGPGARQPIRTPTGGGYGEAQALEGQQQGAPLPASDPGMAAGRQPAGGGGAGGVPGGGAFGPTQRPDEQITAGLTPEGQTPDADTILRQIYDAYPSPYILELLS